MSQDNGGGGEDSVQSTSRLGTEKTQSVPRLTYISTMVPCLIIYLTPKGREKKREERREDLYAFRLDHVRKPKRLGPSELFSRSLSDLMQLIRFQGLGAPGTGLGAR